MPRAELSDNRERAEQTLRAALKLLGLLPTREQVKAGRWAAAVGVVCDQLDAAEQPEGKPCT